MDRRQRGRGSADGAEAVAGVAEEEVVELHFGQEAHQPGDGNEGDGVELVGCHGAGGRSAGCGR